MNKELVFVIEPTTNIQTGKVINSKGELINLATFPERETKEDYQFMINDLANDREELLELTGQMSMIEYYLYRGFYMFATALKLKAKMIVDFYDEEKHTILHTRHDDNVHKERKYVTPKSNPIKDDLSEYFNRMV